MKPREVASLSAANQAVEVTPVTSMSSVEVEKDSILYSKVTIFVSNNEVSFRFGHAEAERFRLKLADMILSAQPEELPASSAASRLPEQLRELAQLRDEGILTEAEFASRKAKLLG